MWHTLNVLWHTIKNIYIFVKPQKTNHLKSNEEFLTSLPEKRNDNFLVIKCRLRGELKNKVITEITKKEITIQSHSEEVFKYYYDNHPHKMTY